MGDIGVDDQNDLLDISLSRDESIHLHNNMVYTFPYEFVAQGD